MRWRFTGAASVTRWKVSLDGRTVGTVQQGSRSLLRKRVAQAGRHRWKVVGVDSAGKRVVSGTRSFRAVKRRG